MDWLTTLIVAIFTSIFKLTINAFKSSFQILWGIITGMFSQEFLTILIIAIIITLLLLYLPKRKRGKNEK